MRRQLVDILRCPSCHSRMILDDITEDEIEVVIGIMTCEYGHRISIDNGIVDAVRESVHEQALNESAGNVRFVEINSELYNDEWLLGLPYSACHVPNPQKKGLDQVQNITTLAERVGWSSGDRVLDLGAGNCWAARVFASKGMSVVATDISHVKYHGLGSGRVLIESTGHYFDRVLTEMEYLPFADGSFDGVLMYQALHHSNNIAQTIAECYRVVRPGGYVLLVHEGVSAVLRNNKYLGIRSVHDVNWQEFDWNEQSFWLHQYLGAARKAGFRARVILPPFIERRLESGDFSGLLFGSLGHMASRVWHLPGGRRMLSSKGSVWFASYLVGMPMTAVLLKPTT